MFIASLTRFSIRTRIRGRACCPCAKFNKSGITNWGPSIKRLFSEVDKHNYNLMCAFALFIEH